MGALRCCGGTYLVEREKGFVGSGGWANPGGKEGGPHAARAYYFAGGYVDLPLLLLLRLRLLLPPYSSPSSSRSPLYVSLLSLFLSLTLREALWLSFLSSQCLSTCPLRSHSIVNSSAWLSVVLMIIVEEISPLSNQLKRVIFNWCWREYTCT